METEIWNNIPWYPLNYFVSNLWFIKNINYRRTWNEKILSNHFNWTWYLQVHINNKLLYKKNHLVHRLVAKTFIPNSENKPHINHKNWNKSDNSISNLEWCTSSENHIHAFRILWRIHNMKWKFWKNSHSAKKVNQYTKDLEFIRTWDSIIDVQMELWILWSNISSVLSNRSKTAWWFIWTYCDSGELVEPIKK